MTEFYHNSFVSTVKFTIVVSAYRANADHITNLINTERLATWLSEEQHLPFVRAVGVYNGDSEQSFVIHTNSSSKLSLIRAHVFEQYKQDAVLFSHNQHHVINLCFPDGNQSEIGSHFVRHASAPKVDSYTVLNGTDYYTVD